MRKTGFFASEQDSEKGTKGFFNTLVCLLGSSVNRGNLPGIDAKLFGQKYV